MAGRFLVDGEAQTAIDPGDRGLSYGDGLFETVAVRLGQPLRWKSHLTRLGEGATRLGIPMPAVGLWEADLARLLGAATPERVVLKLILTRGVGGRGYAPPAAPKPTRIVHLSDWPTWPGTHAETGIVVRLCATRLGINPTLAGVKHLNRLEQVLAARELAATGADEGLMLDCDGRLIEGVRTNVFMVVEDRLVTPSLSRCGVRGVMRDALIGAAQELGIPILEQDCDPTLLAHASELFVCNSLIGLWPVRAIQGWSTPSLSAGPVTRRLQAWLEHTGRPE